MLDKFKPAKREIIKKAMPIFVLMDSITVFVGVSGVTSIYSFGTCSHVVQIGVNVVVVARMTFLNRFHAKNNTLMHNKNPMTNSISLVVKVTINTCE
ncbi:MAG: hypothetical protein LAKADJCE_00982 [Candidatus Argoarchaeum ethanivorans]|uniref:Uncharacterized protein n=1 Tax=Candidatus Argoarchaeum ethanivorans TaxID=2608793 RepID=A0A811TGL0_9EURY|nr:MAG: hypothetical protein LAKADJCE_00982 [Candidatus Argoarchaeum ethanivorans]